MAERPLGWSAVSVARKLGIPVTSGFHTNFDRYSVHYGMGWMPPAVAAYLRTLHRRTLATMVPTSALAADLAVEGDGPACLYVGRLAAEKNLALVKKTFAAIQVWHPKAKMIWVGDGPSAKQLAVDHPDHHFAGVRIGEDLAAHYASADLFLFPCLTETYGNVVAEAMASGLPVIAYRSAAAAELIAQQKNGMVASPGDERGYVDGALWMLEESERLDEMAEAARQTMLPRSWAGVVETFEKVAREAMSIRA